MRHLLLSLFLICSALPSAQAQLVPGMAGGEAQAVESAPAEPAKALIDILKNDDARQGLIAELEKIAQDQPSAETPASGNTADGATAKPGLADDLDALARRGLTRAQESAEDFASGLAKTSAQLEALSDPKRLSRLVAALKEMALTILATTGVFWALRLPARRLTLWIGAAAASKRSPHRVLHWLLCLAINAATVLIAATAGFMLAWGVIGMEGEVSPAGVLFANAFLLSQLARVAIRAVLMPRIPALRLPPFTDDGALAWSRRFTGLAALLGYGLLLVAPMVGQAFSIFTERAVEVVIYVIAAIWSIILTWRHRGAAVGYLRRREAERGADASTQVLKALAHVAHWPALLWLLVLFVVAVSEAGAVEPLLIATGKALGVLALGGAVAVGLGEMARHGVRLPESVTATLPLMEPRLNSFLRSFLGVGRLLILLIAIVAAARVSGLISLSGDDGLLDSATLSALATVGLIAAAAFALWLGIVSWVDYRLSEDRFPPATAREQTLLTLLRNAATVALLIISLMMILSELGLDIGPLLASAGVLGLAIGFGAQKLVQDIITGIFIQFERAISVGDVVTVSSTTGTVEKLTVRSVSLRDVNGVFHIIPFSSVDMVSNFTRDFSCHVADLGIAYRESVTDGKQAMLDAFDELRDMEPHRHDIIGDLEWFGVNALGDSAVTLRARLRTKPGRQWAVGRAYNELLKKHCDARDVEIPFPQTTLWFGVGKDGGAPPMRIESSARHAGPESAQPSKKSESDATEAPQDYDTPDGEEGQ